MEIPINTNTIQIYKSQIIFVQVIKKTIRYS